jgi:hypothetical protein
MQRPPPLAHLAAALDSSAPDGMPPTPVLGSPDDAPTSSLWTMVCQSFLFIFLSILTSSIPSLWLSQTLPPQSTFDASKVDMLKIPADELAVGKDVFLLLFNIFIYPSI